MTLIAVTKDYIYVDEMVTISGRVVNYQPSAKILRIGREGILLIAGIGSSLAAVATVKDMLLKLNDPNLNNTEAYHIVNDISRKLMSSENSFAASFWTYVTKTHVFSLTIDKHAKVAMYLHDELIDGKSVVAGSGGETFRVYHTRGFSSDKAAQLAVMNTPTCGGTIRKLKIASFFQTALG